MPSRGRTTFEPMIRFFLSQKRTSLQIRKPDEVDALHQRENRKEKEMVLSKQRCLSKIYSNLSIVAESVNSNECFKIISAQLKRH